MLSLLILICGSVCGYFLTLSAQIVILVLIFGSLFLLICYLNDSQRGYGVLVVRFYFGMLVLSFISGNLAWWLNSIDYTAFGADCQQLIQSLPRMIFR